MWKHIHDVSAIFTKWNKFRDFLLASLENEALTKAGRCLKKRICSYGSKFFPLRIDPYWEWRENENDRIASSETVTIHIMFELNPEAETKQLLFSYRYQS